MKVRFLYRADGAVFDRSQEMQANAQLGVMKLVGKNTSNYDLGFGEGKLLMYRQPAHN
jgi:hypothetical protein